ncbi:hypothetical protein MSHOH_3732 [Methanosarcina horonobensis HB-1 = JCM 15518]|uniref:Uncharacterized protein n=1 Tax=Methanosarcina horonobensis HB-1 = JCM 15518 TaxID=1434110 RepID=A0A0E3WVN9_9EURY|nr:hypothetical protein MSHOH_3732 [Methanosarcina horonobensis HB-1 = JCM 15518]
MIFPFTPVIALKSSFFFSYESYTNFSGFSIRKGILQRVGKDLIDYNPQRNRGIDIKKIFSSISIYIN